MNKSLLEMTGKSVFCTDYIGLVDEKVGTSGRLIRSFDINRVGFNMGKRLCG